MRKSLLSFSGIFILGLILLFINAIGDKLFGRFFVDLTEEGLYSLSEGSLNILKGIEDPITFRFYYSKTDGSKYPALKLYGSRILDLLKEYERQSGGKVNLEVYDPRPDTEEEEWAQKYGLSPMQLPSGEKLFLGLAAVNSGGTEDSIPLFDLSRQEYLEYDVTKLVYAVRSAKKPVIGVISALNIKGSPAMPQLPGRPMQGEQQWILVSQLMNFAEVQFLTSELDVIPENIDILLLIHPKNLSEKTLYAVDQYAVRGGSLFIAVDPFCGSERPTQDPSNPMAQMVQDRSSNLKSLLSTWGVSMVENKVVGDLNLATRVTLTQGAQPEVFPVWITLSDKVDRDAPVINQDDLTTAQLENIMLAWPGALEVSSIEGINVQRLFTTTKEAALYDDSDIKMFGDNPQEVLKKYKAGDKEYALGVRISGKLKSSFAQKPGSDVQQEQNMSSGSDHLAVGTKEANIVVVADADFLADQYSAVSQRFFGTQLVQLLNDNLIFAANALENLSGSSDLISLRSRGKFIRPFSEVMKIEARAQQKWQQEEQLLQAQLNEANQRLAQIQSGTKGNGDSSKSIVDKAVLDELKKFREQRKDAQQRLREVRRRLREDKEQLGSILFFCNTFLIPLLLIVGAVVWYYLKHRRTKNLGK